MLNKKGFLFLLWVIIIGLTNPVQSQVLTGGLPFIQNYNKEDYKTSENQHWAVIQNKEGLTFFGNNEGLLIFDGANWELLELPNKSVVRSLAIDSSGVIYVGGKNEFGKLTGNAELGYNYVSISDSLPEGDKIMEDIWRIYVTDKDHIIFQSFASVVLWNKTDFKVIYPQDKFHMSFFVENTFYVNERNNRGLLMYINDTLRSAPNAAALANFSIYEMLPFSNTEILVITRSNGTFLYNKKTGILKKNKSWDATNQLLKRYNVFSAVKYDDETYLFGTLRSGLIIVKNGEIHQILNKDLGLIDNTIWSIYVDRNKNLLLALDNGISYVTLNSYVRLFNQSSGVTNAVLAVEKYKNQLFIGTINGIFTNISTDKFSEVGKSNGFVWQLITIDNELYATTYNGLLKRTNNGDFIHIGPKEYVWKIIVLKEHPNKVIAGTRDGGLLLYERTTSGLRFLQKIKGFDRSSRWIEEDNKGRIWVSHYNRGLMLLTLSNDADSVLSTRNFSTENGLPSNTNNYVFKSAKFAKQLGIIIGTENGAFTFDDTKDRFTKIKALDKIKGERFLNQYMEYDGNKAAYQYGEHIGIIHFKNDSITDLTLKPFSYFSSNFCDVIKPISSTEVIFGNTKGLYYYNANQKNQLLNNEVFNLVFRKLMLGNKRYSSSTDAVEVSYEENTFISEFSLPFYTHNYSTEFQFKLEGFDKNWSNWSTTRYKEYTNLREGCYKFMVRSKTVNQENSAVKSFVFTIKPPFYRTIIAYFLFIIISIILIWLIVIYNLKRVEKEKVQLQLIVEERTSELSLQNIELKALHEEKDHILNIVAHDLRSPFQQIKGLTHLINIDDSLSEEKVDYLEKINLVITQGNQLISDLLDVSTAQQDKELTIIPIQLNQLIEDLKSQCIQQVTAKEQQFIINISNNLPPLHSDRLLIWRLLENLVSNAVKYSPKGKTITLEVSFADDLFTISIKDEGPGFSKEDKELMFHKFQKLSAKPTNDESSTGLGLSIVKIIADRLDATIEVTTALGEGTEFIVKIKNKISKAKVC